jgi:hypothetical protein
MNPELNPEQQPEPPSSYIHVGGFNQPGHSRSSTPKTQLSTYCTHLDRGLARIYQCINASAGNDVLLLFVFFLLRVSKNLLQTLKETAIAWPSTPPKARLRHATQSNKHLVKWICRLEDSSKEMLSTIAQVRAILRLRGSLGVYQSIKRLVREQVMLRHERGSEPGTARSFIDTATAFAQLLFMLSFYLADNVNVLSVRKVLRFSPATRTKLASWSLRSWVLYTGTALARLLAQNHDPESEEATRRWRRQLWLSLVAFIIAVNNSAENSPLNDMTVLLLGLYLSGLKMKGVWRDSTVITNSCVN